MSKIHRCRGVSTFIAVLLLMVLAVSAGAVIYAFTMGYLGGLGGGGGQGFGALSLDSAVCSPEGLTAYVRNVGRGTLSLDKAYVDSMLVEGAGYTFEVNSPGVGDDDIEEGGTGKVTVQIPGGFVVGKKYESKIFSADNTQITFTVVSDVASGTSIWHFDEGSGSSVGDSSGEGNDGTVYGAEWTTGVYGGGLSFNGVGDYVEIPDSDIFDWNNDGFSVEAWIYPVAWVGNYDCVVTKGSDSLGVPTNEFPVWRLQARDDGGSYGARFSLWEDSPGVKADWALSLDEGYQLVGTYEKVNGTHNRMRLYINGELEKEYVGTCCSGYPQISEDPIWIGTGYYDGHKSDYFNGSIDEVSVYSRALTPEEVQMHFEALAQ